MDRFLVATACFFALERRENVLDSKSRRVLVRTRGVWVVGTEELVMDGFFSSLKLAAVCTCKAGLSRCLDGHCS